MSFVSREATIDDISERLKVQQIEFDGKIQLMRDEMRLIAATEAREATKQWIHIALSTAGLLVLIIGSIVTVLKFMLDK